MDTAHRLTDPDGVGQCQCDGKRQSFRDSDNEDGDSNDEVLDKDLNVRVGPRLVTNGKRLDAERQHQYHHRRDRNCRAYSHATRTPLIDWLSWGFTSHSTRNRSFLTSQSIGLVLKTTTPRTAYSTPQKLPLRVYIQALSTGWLRGTVVERRSVTGELSLSYARHAADGRPLMCVNRPL